MTRICILVLCGLPASGKTTCARWLKTSTGRLSCGSGESSADSGLPATDVGPPDNSPCSLQQPAAHTYFIHVAYDDIMTTDTEKELLSQMLECSSKVNDGNELSKWKKYRKEILKCVAKHIEDCSLEENESLNKSVQESPDEDIWNTFCKSLHTSPEKEAEENLAESKDLNPAESKDLNLAESKDLVYIIDDNMYYRSMRYEYYQLARQYSAGFAQVYFKTSLEDAQQRNSSRASPVKPEVITNMASRIEPPGGPEALDKHTLIIPDNRSEDFIPALLHLIMEALGDPVPALQEEDQEEKEAARVVCSTNLIHQTDQVLRRLVAQAMAQAKEAGQDKTSMKELAARTNKARQGILEEMRQGRLLVDSRLNKELDAGKQNDSDLYLFVTRLFDKAVNENS